MSMADDDSAIVATARTPIGNFGGTLRDSSAVELGAHAIAAACRRSSVDPTDIDEVIVGHARQASNGPNPGRLMAIAAGMPTHAPVQTVQQACLSSMKAAILGMQSIRLGDAQIVIAAGSEHMSGIPFFSPDTRWGRRMGDSNLVDGVSKDGFMDPLTGKHMGQLADSWSIEYSISREEQDAYALRSQQRVEAAKKEGFADALIEPIEVRRSGKSQVVTEDEHPRPDTSLESLRRLEPVFARGGSVTAGNASGITDGAAAIVLMAGTAAKRRGIAPLAYARSYAVAALQPERYGLAVVPATRQALTRAGITLDDLDAIEINEAFAIQVLAACAELKLDPERVNPAGGAIALGHPVGMSGVRVIQYVVETLHRNGGQWGLATICGNGGQGAAVVVERA